MTTAPSLLHRAKRRLQLAAQAHGVTPLETPPFLVLFVTSACNLQCEHCYVHADLNRSDDLRFEEIVKLSEELGTLEHLDVCGGEPFLRDDLAAVCEQFIQHNGLSSLHLTTSGYHPQRCVEVVEQILQCTSLRRLVVELSIDGTANLHNRLRADAQAFDQALRSYDALSGLAQRDRRLRLSCVSTAMADNLAEIERLSDLLRARCPALERHRVQPLRAERRNPCLRPADPVQLRALERALQRRWEDRAADGIDALMRPALERAKHRGAQLRAQAVPCKAGVLSAVVYANGDIGVCENRTSHPVIGNLREPGFRTVWTSPKAQKARAMVRARQCACDNELFLRPSLACQPAHLARALISSKLGAQPKRPLPQPFERAGAGARPPRVQLPIAL